MQFQRLELFNTKKEFFTFLGLCLFILFYALLIQYNNYKNLTRFDTALVDAKVLKQYTKTKLSKNKKKSYQVLKLRAKEGFSFYTTTKKDFPDSVNKELLLEIKTSDINFYEYLTSFYAYSSKIKIDKNISLKERLNNHLSDIHPNSNIASIYKALYTATQLNSDLQTTFSTLGVSHLLAISGFHLGVLSGVLFFMFKIPYSFLQQRYFPYRSYKVDSFIFISLTLLIYLLFLDTPPSLLRAYGMLLIGFVLYDRGYQIVSMQTLLLTVILLLSLFPKLFFSFGFWLSVSGVFYIFLFLLHFRHLSKLSQFALVPFWVYLMMLPFSLTLFGNFSIYHPLSIVWTTIFSVFYPLSILVHLIGQGDILDPLLIGFLNITQNYPSVELGYIWLILHITLSLIAIFKQRITYLIMFETLVILSFSFIHITT